MVRQVAKFWILPFFIAGTLARSEPKQTREDFDKQAVVEIAPKPVLSLRPYAVVVNSDSGSVRKVTFSQIEGTDLKFVQFVYEASPGPAFLIIKEQNVARGKTADGADDATAPARIIISVAPATFGYFPVSGGRNILLPKRVEFQRLEVTNKDKGEKDKFAFPAFEVINRNVERLKSITDRDNILYLKESHGNLPSMELPGLTAIVDGKISAGEKQPSLLDQLQPADTGK